MTCNPSPTQTLILWRLIASGGEAWQKDIRPILTKPDRTALERGGLIVGEKRGRAIWIEVTDSGWAWANDHLDAELPVRTLSAGPILQAWLTCLQAFMRQRGVALAEIMGPSAEASADTPGDLEARIRQAYLRASGGAWDVRVHLHRLRQLLDDVPRIELDDTLLRMQRGSRLVLFGLDNQREITPEDRLAAIHIGGESRHVLRMGR